MKQIKNKKLTKILIIGSSGFIGKSLVDYLCNKRSNISEIHTISRKKFTVKKNNKIYLKKITKNIFKLDKIPEVDFIIYLIRSDKISISLIDIFKEDPKNVEKSLSKAFNNKGNSALGTTVSSSL